MRLLDLLRKSTEQLEAAGIEDPLAEAELLVFYAANMEWLDAYVNNPEVTGSAYAKARRYLKRRLKGEPVQYIVGHIEFFGLAITVGRGVLIPRPETEMLVEEAIKTADRWRKNWSLAARRSPLSVLDLCTGSGCMALALAKEFPDAEVIGTDLSQDALAFAEKNAKLNAIRNAQFLHGPFFDQVKGKRFDLIVANPPYIKRDEIALLQREIRDWEPRPVELDGVVHGRGLEPRGGEPGDEKGEDEASERARRTGHDPDLLPEPMRPRAVRFCAAAARTRRPRRRERHPSILAEAAGPINLGAPGVPPGVINIVHGGGGKVGMAIVEHPEVDLVSFTGSTDVGKRISEVASQTLKRVSLELGGKDAQIVMPDADMDLALDGVLWGAFGTTGQRCTSTSRLILHEKIHDEFLGMLCGQSVHAYTRDDRSANLGAGLLRG